MKIPAALRRVHLPTLLALTAFFGGALLLRAWGLTWGLPSAARYYPYHPDETVLLNAICGVNPLWGDVAPTFYNYGSLHILLSRLAYDVVSPFLGWGTVPRFDQPFPSWVGDFARLLLVGRWMTVLLGAATVPATYALGRRLFSARTGWLAALFLAVAPLPVLLSHYLTVDVPAAFFTTLSLFFAAQALGSAEPKPALRWVAAAGFVAGLAIGTKYSSLPALLALGVPLWHLSRAKGGRSRAIAAGALAVALCAAGFLLATPGALLEPVKFSKDLAYEMGRNREGQGLLFKATPPALLYHLGISLPVGLEWPLYLLSMAGVAVALWRRRPADWLLLVFLGLTFLMLAPAERKFLRYVTPLFPPLLVLAARAVDEGLASRSRRLWAGWGALAGAAALASTIAHLGVLAQPDARDQAAAYLRQQARSGDVVALGADPWYYTPPIHPTTGCVKWAIPYGGPPVWDRTLPGEARPELTRLESFTVLAPGSNPPAGALPVAKLSEYRPRFVVLTDYEYDDPERIRRYDRHYESGILELMAALKADYRVREFRPRPSLGGFTWWRHGVPPHDWRYFMPTVRIYERVP